MSLQTVSAQRYHDTVVMTEFLCQISPTAPESATVINKHDYYSVSRKKDKNVFKNLFYKSWMILMIWYAVS